ncbi:MAG TPA: hypothetical protein VKV74_01140 [Bryobacteraceae bacterium]|nr:hypothetical protein [Bryobacteraceae bacterium]HZP32347.1 hypothetical protein [Candidatus Acidoferrales bacterium]
MATNPHPSPSPGYEKTDASPRGLIYFVATIAAILAITAAFLFFLFHYYQRSETGGAFVAQPFVAAEPTPPPPRIQPDPTTDMRTYADSQQKLLNTYGWVDRQNGIVRLPIDRAMQLLVERGLPTRSTNEPEKRAANPRPRQQSQIAVSQGAGQ